ncbi:MAG: glycosyltransferase family 2 protein [Cytophagales bacterium]
MPNRSRRNSTKLTLAVCTYNRAEILSETILALFKQDCSLSEYEILIINNNSSDNTQNLLDKYESYANFRSVVEYEVGLSKARNRALIESWTDWVAFIDDDGKIHKNFVRRCLWVIENFDFACFGGVYLPWYKYGKPKWFRDELGSNGFILKEVGELKNHNASGGIMAIHANTALSLGGFDPTLGMKGNQVLYGEESAIQVKMKKKGFRVGFDPELLMDHLVPRYKMSPWWFVKSEYLKAKKSWLAYSVVPEKKDKNLLVLIRLMIAHPKRSIRFIPKLFEPDYFWQNFMLDILSPWAYDLGKYVGANNYSKDSNYDEHLL